MRILGEPPSPAHAARAVGASAVAIAAASLIIAVLESAAGVPDASAVYVLAVAIVALVAGRTGAVIAAVGSFLTYDYFFIEPVYTFTVHDPGEWLNLTLLLVIGLLVGQLAAELRARADDARAREREARAMFDISRELATRPSTTDALSRIAAIIRTTGGFDRAWFTGEASPTSGQRARRLADTAPDRPVPGATGYMLLRRTPGDAPARWHTIHTATIRRARGAPVAGDGSADHEAARQRQSVLRVTLEAGGRPLGSLWATRRRALGLPTASDTRLLASAADQVAQALEQDRLAEEAREAEIARRSDALKTALLESVSHDLRTPLASIRAAAGSLTDRDLPLSEQDRIASAQAIDREAERLNHIVTNLLDLSRIEGGALRVDREVYDLADVTESALARVRPNLGDRPLEIDLDGLPPVEIDAVFFERIIVNLLENAARHTPPGTPIRITGRPCADRPAVRLTVEDAGPGVPPEALPRLFDKFFRAAGRSAAAKGGTGIGLSVVRGLAEAMGGAVDARRGELGGLAIDVDLPAAPAQEAEMAGPA